MDFFYTTLFTLLIYFFFIERQNKFFYTGATTSRMHTAVKISPNYMNIDHPVVHVLDSSRSVVVVSSLLELNEEKREDYVEDVIDLYEEMREEY